MVSVSKTFKTGGLVRAQNVWTKGLHISRISANGNAQAALFGRGTKGTGLTGVGFPWLPVTSVFHYWGQGSGHRGSQDHQVKLSRSSQTPCSFRRVACVLGIPFPVMS